MRGEPPETASQVADACPDRLPAGRGKLEHIVIAHYRHILYFTHIPSRPFGLIKCSICSYKCDSLYDLNWDLACHAYFSTGRGSLELAQTFLCVALAWLFVGSSTPNGLRARLLRRISTSLQRENARAVLCRSATTSAPEPSPNPAAWAEPALVEAWQ